MSEVQCFSFRSFNIIWMAICFRYRSSLRLAQYNSICILLMHSINFSSLTLFSSISQWINIILFFNYGILIAVRKTSLDIIRIHAYAVHVEKFGVSVCSVIHIRVVAYCLDYLPLLFIKSIRFHTSHYNLFEVNNHIN